LETAKETVGYARHTRQKTYVTEETCSLIRQERGKAKQPAGVQKAQANCTAEAKRRQE